MLTAGSIIVTVLGVLVVCYSVLFSGGNRRESQSLRYSVVIEGGSTVSRIHVYEIELGNYVRVAKYANRKLHPGLSAYAYDPHGASLQLKELLKFAKGEIPKGMWKETEVRLIATTGRRFFHLIVRRKILKVGRKVLRSSGFKFCEEWANVISGSEDVVNASVVTNIALASLGGIRLNLTNLVELIEAARSVEHVFPQGKAGEENKLCLWRMCWPKAWRVGLF